MTNRELKFDLNVESSALLCPNPTGFYAKAYFYDDVANNFRTLPGIKYQTKLATVDFTNILKSSDCNAFPATSETLSAVTLSVCGLSAFGEICQFDLEQSFVSAQMAQGSNGNWQVADFMNFYWEQMANEIGSELAQLRWRGNTTNSAFSGNSAFLALCDGYEKVITGATGSILVTATATTVGNIITILDTAISNVPAKLISRPEDLRIYMNGDSAMKYRRATAAGNTLAYITETLALSYLGIPITIQPGMSNNAIVITRPSNLIYSFDGEGDGKDIKAVNLEDSIAEPKLRSRVNLKAGFSVVNPNEIVFVR